MDGKTAVAAAKAYILDIYADENVTNLDLEEIEHNQATGNWTVTIGLSRPWNSPRTRTQEVLESIGGVSSLKRAFKVITLSETGEVLSMKNRERAAAAE